MPVAGFTTFAKAASQIRTVDMTATRSVLHNNIGARLSAAKRFPAARNALIPGYFHSSSIVRERRLQTRIASTPPQFQKPKSPATPKMAQILLRSVTELSRSPEMAEEEPGTMGTESRKACSAKIRRRSSKAPCLANTNDAYPQRAEGTAHGPRRFIGQFDAKAKTLGAAL